MADFQYVLVSSGLTVSAAFTLERADRPLVVEVPSLAAGNGVTLQFSATSGGPFFSLQRDDGSGLVYAVHSGSGPAYGVIRHVPSPWGRFSFTGSPGDVRTLTIYTTKRN